MNEKDIENLTSPAINDIIKRQQEITNLLQNGSAIVHSPLLNMDLNPYEHVHTALQTNLAATSLAQRASSFLGTYPSLNPAWINQMATANDFVNNVIKLNAPLIDDIYYLQSTRLQMAELSSVAKALQNQMANIDLSGVGTLQNVLAFDFNITKSIFEKLELSRFYDPFVSEIEPDIKELQALSDKEKDKILAEIPALDKTEKSIRLQSNSERIKNSKEALKIEIFTGILIAFCTASDKVPAELQFYYQMVIVGLSIAIGWQGFKLHQKIDKLDGE